MTDCNSIECFISRDVKEYNILIAISEECSNPIYVKDSSLCEVYHNSSYSRILGSNGIGVLGSELIELENLVLRGNSSQTRVFNYSTMSRKGVSSNEIEVKLSLVNIKGEKLLVGEVIPMDALKMYKPFNNLNASVQEKLIEKSNILVLTVSPDLVVKYVGPQVFRVIGMHPYQVLNKSLADIFCIDLDYLNNKVSEGIEELVIPLPNQSMKYVNVQFIPDSDYGWQLLVRDVSSKIRMQKLTQNQNSILRAVGEVMVELSQCEDIHKSIGKVIEKIGFVSEMVAVRMYEVYNSVSELKLTHEWVKDVGMVKVEKEVISDITRIRRLPVYVRASESENILVPEQVRDLVEYIICCPIFIKGKYWGVMYFYSGFQSEEWVEMKMYGLNIVAVGVGSILSLREDLVRYAYVSNKGMELLDAISGNVRGI